MGITTDISKSTLADANENRDWRIYADFAQVLISKAKSLYCDDDLGLDLKNIVYALDSTTIDLCLSLFPWAHFRKKKGAVKLHRLLDLRGNIPTFILITTGKIHDVNVVDELIIEAGSFYIMDRGYIDFKRLYQINIDKGYFVVRAKSNLKYRRLYSLPIDKSTGLKCDQIIVLTGKDSSRDYPLKLRRIRYYDKTNNKYFTFLNKQFQASNK